MDTAKKTYACDVLMVDDDEFNLRTAGDIIKDKYSILTVRSGEAALEFLEEKQPRLILLDLYMAGIDGRETMKRIKANKEWKNIPIIILTADTSPKTEKECIELGASGFITKPFVPMVMMSYIGRMIELAELQNDLEEKLEEKTELLEKVTLNAIMVIANTIDAKDAYTSGHSMRVAECSTAIAKRLNRPEKEVQNIHYVALLHDIGKIGVPDGILNKPGKLKPAEFEMIKKHPLIGNDILKGIHIIENVAEGALFHHERYDGHGYPFGLTGEKIPYCARIIGIADAYDAMTSNRIYRSRLSREHVIKEFENGRGSQFDPELTDLFLDMLREGFDVTTERRSISGDEEAVNESSAMLSKALSGYETNVQQEEITDSLTGVYTGNYAEEQIGKILKKVHPGAFMMIDMDNLKHINDTYGHIIGDNVLRMLANTLKENTTPEDVVCRLGGDDFAVFLTEISDRQEIAKKAQNILDMFSENLKKMDCEKAASVSIGIAAFPGDGKSFDMLYKNADKSLYHVKRNGKNAYAFYSDEKTKDKVLNTGTDLEHIRTMLEGNLEDSSGVFNVEYQDFRRIYSYISRSVKRKHQQVQTLLFTLSGDENENPGLNSEEPMQTLELAVASSVRMVDVGTRYSNIQYIVILLDTDMDNGSKVADRIVKKFYQMYGGRGIMVSYDIQTMESRTAEEASKKS